MESMNSGFVATPREQTRLAHGWSMDLRCPTCGHQGLPRVTGWTPHFEIQFGDTPTIYAHVHCGQCGTDLKKEAGEKLIETFAPLPIPNEQRDTIAILLLAIAGAPVFLLGGWLVGAQLGWWPGFPAYLIGIIPLAMVPAFHWFQSRAHRFGEKCGCGQPDYEFMGMLGRTYCHRCRKCGKLLRLVD